MVERKVKEKEAKEVKEVKEKKKEEYEGKVRLPGGRSPAGGSRGGTSGPTIHSLLDRGQ